MTGIPPESNWRTRTRGAFERGVIKGDDVIDAAFRRINRRFGRHRPNHIAAYRSFSDAQGVELMGRLLAHRPLGGPGEHDSWWHNLRNTYRRFATDEVPFASMRAEYRGARVNVDTDHEGYYFASF